MEALKCKLKTTLLYSVVSLILAIVLPILMKNGWACFIGIAAFSLFAFQSYSLYNRIKNKNFIEIRVTCVDIQNNSLGAATFAKLYTFENIEPELYETTTISLQIVSDTGKKKKDKIFVKGLYTLVFEPLTTIIDGQEHYIFNNSNFITYFTGVNS